MNTRKIIFGIVVLWTLTSQAIGGSEGPVYLRLCWKPGETLRYKLQFQSNANVDGEHAQISMVFELALNVIGHSGTDNTPSEDVAQPGDANHSQALSSGEHLTEVELEHGAVQMNIHTAGQKLAITIGKDSVSASLNGRLLPSYQLDELRSEVKPLQEILKSPIHLWMTRSGRIVRVSGLEKLDPATQKELALGYLQGMMLPEKPMKVGDHFIDRRSLDSLFPNQAGNSSSALAGRTVEIVRTLQRVRRDDRGKLVAEFLAPLKEKFYNVHIDEDGTTGSAELDLVYTTSFDVDRGTVVRETVKGTILLRPKGRVNVPNLITVRVDGAVTLIEMKKTNATARSYRGD